MDSNYILKQAKKVITFDAFITHTNIICIFVACGGNMNTESGIVQSPGYPNSQYSKRECEWLITVPEGRRITFQFIDLDIDLEDFQGLVFFNDKTYRSVIKYIMQYNSTEVIESSGNVMYIIFWNTIASSQRGFKAEYSSNEPTSKYW